MKLLVAVPSKGRPKAIYKHTMRWLPRVGYDVKVFCEPQEIAEYRANAADTNYNNYVHVTDDWFIDIGKNDAGLGYVKQFIREYALANGYELVFKMDDDVQRFNARGKNKPDDLMVPDFINMVGTCRVTLGRYPDVAAIGFGYRNELFENKQWVGINYRLQSCYLIRTEFIQSGYNTFEDFAQFIYIRANNKNTLRYGLLGIDAADVGKNKGGLQLFDRKAQALEEIDRLRAIYPAIEFKPVPEKAWKYEPVLKGEWYGTKKL